MKYLVIAAVVLWTALHVGGLLIFPQDAVEEATFARLVEPPQRSIGNPYHNGYFYFFGFTAAASLDPAKTGYEIWVENTEAPRRGEGDEGRARKADLVLTVSDTTAPDWEADDPLVEFQKSHRPFQAGSRHYPILLSRYERWTAMPFDDWGFGRRVTPLAPEIFAVHRLYVAQGFSRNSTDGLDRLQKDLRLWRTILREAKTVDTKVFAQIILSDDLQLLSRILAKPTVDKAVLGIGLELTLPLSWQDYSLRWPVRNQLALALKDKRAADRIDREQDDRRHYEEWLMTMGHLPSDAFDGIVHPPSRASAVPLARWGQAMGRYGTYYDALIMASETNATHLPAMREVAGTAQRGLLESVFNSRPVEPRWEIFHSLLMDTDTRLRLASLQIQLRHPSRQTAVPTRLAEIGSRYFDPFTALPMLWSPTQQKLYSVGKDRLDDGGDPTFDISVPAVAGPTIVASTATQLPRPRATRSSGR